MDSVRCLESVARSQSAPHREVVRARGVVDGGRRSRRTLTIAARRCRCRRASVQRAGALGSPRTGWSSSGRSARAGVGRSTIPAGQDRRASWMLTPVNYRPAGRNPLELPGPMAAATGVSKIDCAAGVVRRGALNRTGSSTFKLSRPSEASRRSWSMSSGLYLNPPQNGHRSCAPMRCPRCKRSTARRRRCRSSRGAGETMTHDYKRHD